MWRYHLKTSRVTFHQCVSVWIEKRQYCPLLRKRRQTTLKITVQCLYFLSAENFLKVFLANNLLAPNQSGFKPGDSCINQLLSITHEIYSSFDDGFEVRSVFLDISKAFDKV